MNFIDLFTFWFFVINLVVSLIKLYNISKFGTFYDFRLIFVTFILSLVAWFVNYGTLTSTLSLSEEIVSMQTFIFRVSTLLLVLNAFFTVIELLVTTASYSTALLRKK